MVPKDLPSVKLTYPLKLDGWKTIISLQGSVSNRVTPKKQQQKHPPFQDTGSQPHCPPPSLLRLCGCVVQPVVHRQRKPRGRQWPWGQDLWRWVMLLMKQKSGDSPVEDGPKNPVNNGMKYLYLNNNWWMIAGFLNHQQDFQRFFPSTLWKLTLNYTSPEETFEGHLNS